MTNEDYENEIENLQNRLDITEYDKERLEEKLKTLSAEPCEDAIDRAEAMTEIMMFAGNVKPDEENIYIKVSDTVQLLRELPPVTPKPKTGHWISDKYGQHCNQCGNGINTPYKFCPFCGADMREYTKE